MGKARSRHLQKILSEIPAGREGGEVKIGWVKAHLGILRNEAADVIVKSAAEKVRSLENNEKWMSEGGIRQWTRQRKREYLEEDGEAAER